VTTPPTPPPPSVEEFDLELDFPADDERKTHVYLRAVCGELQRDFTVRPDVEADAKEPARADRIVWDAARSADEAARFEHRRRVVAPLLMLLALGLLFAAGWSC